MQVSFEEELSSMDAVLEKAKERLEEDGGTLIIPILKTLIKSKGSDPPDKRKKDPFKNNLGKSQRRCWLETYGFC